MATVIRLKRGGRTHAPYYRVVVCDGRTRRSGRVLDEIGVYHPCARPEPRVEIDKAKALTWLAKGAQPSTTMRNVLSKQGVLAAYHEGVSAEDVAKAEAAETTAEAAPETTPEPTAEAAPEAQPEGEGK